MPRRTSRLVFALAFVVAPLGASACATLSDSSHPVDYSVSARENYEKGIKELKSENYLEAAKYFQYCKAKFGFSKWATLSELGIADANFGREKFSEAVDGYRTFIKNHPTHEMVQNGYCAFKIGQAYYKEIPGEWFLVPPSHEKDMGPVRDAVVELGAFIEEYADSPYVAESRKMLADCQRRLAEHELYVANFYLAANKPQATIMRLEYLLKTYPHSGVEPDVLLLLGRTYLAMERPKDARDAFDRLILAYPHDFRAGKAKLYLEHIARRWPSDAGGRADAT